MVEQDALPLIGQAKAQLTRSPEDFDDPLALEIDWTPLPRAGKALRSHRLVQGEGFRVAFRPAAKSVVLYLVIGGFGARVLWEASQLWTAEAAINMEVVLTAAVGVVGLVFMVVRLIFLLTPMRFDRRAGRFRVGWKAHNPSGNPSQGPLDSIYALQLMRKVYMGNDQEVRRSAELNLVMRDRSRLNLLDHGDFDALAEDAEALADFLRVPLWRGSD